MATEVRPMEGTGRPGTAEVEHTTNVQALRKRGDGAIAPKPIKNEQPETPVNRENSPGRHDPLRLRRRARPVPSEDDQAAPRKIENAAPPTINVDVERIIPEPQIKQTLPAERGLSARSWKRSLAVGGIVLLGLIVLLMMGFSAYSESVDQLETVEVNARRGCGRWQLHQSSCVD